MKGIQILKMGSAVISLYSMHLVFHLRQKPMVYKLLQSLLLYNYSVLELNF